MQCKVPNSYHKAHAVFLRTPAGGMCLAVTKQVSPGELTSPSLKQMGQPEVQWLPISHMAPFGTTDVKETWVS